MSGAEPKRVPPGLLSTEDLLSSVRRRVARRRAVRISVRIAAVVVVLAIPLALVLTNGDSNDRSVVRTADPTTARPGAIQTTTTTSSPAPAPPTSSSGSKSTPVNPPSTPPASNRTPQTSMTTTTTPTATTPTSTSTKPRNRYTETSGGTANTWTDYRNASGTAGPAISAFQSVQIDCAIQGFRVADGNTWWYRIASAPWSGNFYVSADAFYNNGRTSGSLTGTPFVDPAVRPC
jgi:hypothetical protein